MIADAWETRAEGPLVFSYQADSYVQQHLDTIISDYQKALADVTAFLGLPATSLPAISIYLCEFLPTANGQGSGDDTRRDPEAAEIWSVVNSESPGANPWVELSQLGDQLVTKSWLRKRLEQPPLARDVPTDQPHFFAWFARSLFEDRCQILQKVVAGHLV